MLNDNLHLHLRVHTQDKLYVCDVCGEDYSDERSLHMHTEFVSGQSVSQNGSLQTQVRKHVTDHHCKCDLIFGKNDDLQTHFCQIHINNNNHKCELCGKGFKG